MSASRPARVACIGAGVIGAGWASRFLLNGTDVALHDPDPQAGRKVGEVLENARHCHRRLAGAALPVEGRLLLAADVAEAVAGADFVQESVPEQLELKQRVLAEIDALTRPEVLVASSTSGLLPTHLQARLRHPGRLLVGHPFNPVYLLPLVELVAGEHTAPGVLEQARALYAGVGMKPVRIRREVDAFVGDRLQEALWREALWLVHDDVATVEEIDDVIRYSFGLRWAQMGIFQVYRIAGGEAGMRHFMAQFGPALQWPWTRLTDVPALDDALLDKLAVQSDSQAAGLSIRQLERLRDDNLLAIMTALEGDGTQPPWGAGALLRDYRDALARAAADGPRDAADGARPGAPREEAAPAPPDLRPGAAPERTD